MRKTKTLTMDDSVWNILVKIAKDEDRTVVGIIRNAIKEYLFTHYNIEV